MENGALLAQPCAALVMVSRGLVLILAPTLALMRWCAGALVVLVVLVVMHRRVSTTGPIATNPCSATASTAAAATTTFIADAATATDRKTPRNRSMAARGDNAIPKTILSRKGTGANTTPGIRPPNDGTGPMQRLLGRVQYDANDEANATDEGGINGRGNTPKGLAQSRGAIGGEMVG